MSLRRGWFLLKGNPNCGARVRITAYEFSPLCLTVRWLPHGDIEEYSKVPSIDLNFT